MKIVRLILPDAWRVAARGWKRIEGETRGNFTIATVKFSHRFVLRERNVSPYFQVLAE